MQNTNEIPTKIDKIIDNGFNNLFTGYVKAFYPNIYAEIAPKVTHDLQELHDNVFKNVGHDQ